jgi:MGT family glycosyltransferase
MRRFLFVVPPLTGHVNPTIPLGIELARRGHAVAWSGPGGVVPRLLPEGASFIATNDSRSVDAAMGSLATKSRGLRGAAALKFLWEDVLFPLAESMVAGLDDAIDEFEPDVVICDQQAFAGAAVAKRRGLSWVTSATTSAELTNPLAELPKVDQWVRDELVTFQLEAGVAEPDAFVGDPRFSPELVIAYTTAELVGAVAHDGPVAWVGPSIADRPDDTAFPWEWLDDDVPHVLVSLGTVNADAGERFFREAVAAMADRPLQAIVVAPPELVPDPPANVLVRARVPQLELLPRLHAVVSHARHNTVCETLAHGLPLVVAPIRDDQPIIADQVVRAGAGVRVRFGRDRAAEIGGAVDRVLGDPRYRYAARVIERSFERAGGAPAAAERLEVLPCPVLL